MPSDLARSSVTFSHMGHTVMAAEIPDLHRGDLGRLEKVRNSLVSHRDSTTIYKINLIALL